MTLPARRLPAGPAPPDHADPARGGGRLPRPRLPRRRRPRGRDDALQLRRAQLPAGPSGPLAAPSLFLDDDTVLRTETSPSQIRTMEAQQPPIYIVSLGRVYRRDTPDATHTPVFHQVEGLAVDEGITLADLTGTLDFLLKALFGQERRTEFRTHYFPFTEPSIEAYVSCHVCDGAGCPVCRHSGWIEVGGAGMVDPKLFEFVGYDPERYSGFAFGWGSSGSPCSVTSSPTSGSSGATTSASRGSSSHARARSPGCASTSRPTRPRRDRATALDLGARGRPGDRRRRSRRGRQPRSLRRRAGAVGRPAPERRPPAALPGRRRQPRAAADRLRRLELRRRRDRGGGASRRAPAWLSGAARGAAAAGRRCRAG